MIVRTTNGFVGRSIAGIRMALGLLSIRTETMFLVGLLLGLVGSEGKEGFLPSIMTGIKGRQCHGYSDCSLIKRNNKYNTREPRNLTRTQNSKEFLKSLPTPEYITWPFPLLLSPSLSCLHAQSYSQPSANQSSRKPRHLTPTLLPSSTPLYLKPSRLNLTFYLAFVPSFCA